MRWSWIAGGALFLVLLLILTWRKEYEPKADWCLCKSRFVNNHVLLQVGFRSAEPQWWILDTGSTHHLMDSTYATRFDRRLVGQIQDVNQPGTAFSAQQIEDGYVLAEQGQGPRLTLNNIGVVDLQHLAQSLDVKLAGIIGYPFFAQCVVSIDFPRKQVWLKPNGGFSLPPSPSHRAPALLSGKHGDHHLLLLPMQISNLEPGLWSLDTGSNISIMSHEFAQRNAVKGGAPTQAQLVNRTINIAPVQVECTLGNTTEAATLYAPDQSFAEAIQGLDGNLGLDLLGAHRVTIDYANERVILD